MIDGVRTKTSQGVVHYISFKKKSLNMMCCLREYSFVEFAIVETAAKVVLPVIQVKFLVIVVQVTVVSWLYLTC